MMTIIGFFFINNYCGFVLVDHQGGLVVGSLFFWTILYTLEKLRILSDEREHYYYYYPQQRSQNTHIIYNISFIVVS